MQRTTRLDSRREKRGPRRGETGFTLIELMVVVAIIGILASVAIPNFMRFQLKAKSSEAKMNIAAIRTTQTSYHSELGVFVSAALEPGTLPQAQKLTFAPTAAGFETLGWSPEGQVYFQYGVAVSTDNVGYTVVGVADIDGDGTNQYWGYARPDGAGTLVDDAVGCDESALPAINSVGPCDTAFAQSIF